MIQNNKLLNSFEQKKHLSLKLNSFLIMSSSTDRIMLFHKYLLVFLLFIGISIQSVEANCGIIDFQDIFINSTNYCTMKYCSQSSVAICYQYSCQNGIESCSINFQSTSDVTCDVQCCKNINASQNANIWLSHAYCSTDHLSSETSTTNTQNTQNRAIIINSIVGAVAALALFIVIACCIRHYARRREPEDLHNNRNNNRGTIQTLISSSIDLKDYKLDQQGPYLINIYNQCAICLESNVNLRTHCNHYYHGSCLYEWLNKNPKNPCPLCMSVNFNPIKIYCKKFFAGDQLIIFNGNLRRTQIAAIDDHKCNLCKNNSKEQVIEDDLSRTNKKMKPDQI